MVVLLAPRRGSSRKEPGGMDEGATMPQRDGMLVVIKGSRNGAGGTKKIKRTGN